MKKCLVLTRTPRRMLACCFGICLAWSVNANDSAANTNPSLSLAPGGMHEVCLLLAPQDSLRYSFTGSAALSFNIHYHVNNRVYYPVRESTRLKASGVFTPASRQDYCLMWTNRYPVAVELVLDHEKNSARQ